MDKYTLYCSESQAKKAFELGAQLMEHPFEASIIKANEKMFSNLININEKYYAIPTAEQMIGWLEEQYRIHIESEYSLTYKDYDFCILDENELIGKDRTMFNTNFGLPSYSSRKEATRAAIDAALEYLSLNNNK